MKQRRWFVILLLIGMLSLQSCEKTQHPSGSSGIAYGFTAELAWENAVDLDFFVVNPEGDVWTLYDHTPAVVFAGDNQCGFGAACDPQMCGIYLPCNTREAITVASAEQGTYTLWLSSWTSSKENVTVSVTLPREHVAVGDIYAITFRCTIPANADQALVNIDFSETGHTIANLPGAAGFAVCTITEQAVRAE